MVELRHALRDVERVVVGQRDDARAEHDAIAPLAGGGEEHLRRGDHLPAGRVMLAAPELVVAEPVEVFDEVEVALELEHRVLTERMVWRKKRAELETVHTASSGWIITAMKHYAWRASCQARTRRSD